MIAAAGQRTAAPAVALERGDPGVLEAVVRPEVHLAIWNRPLPLALAWLPQLDWSKIDDLDFTTTLEALEADVAEGLAEAGYPAGARGDALAGEMIDHARRFAAVQQIDALAIRLEVIETDACHKFHADHVTARLLTTLMGTGTQWIHGDAGPDTPIRQMRTGDVAIFKGRLATEALAILHRSPPIGDTGETRLLLAIDPAPAPSLPE
ncbi:DUF1826 domain-containing protein [Sphingomonas sp. ABOLD]|uniref:DUF1826 domain-containing protein n=1 Tax=Sphingomonas trueperi TaxID=53317 RepID=A0A7X5XYD0_9SPHN|nr:MULTISPECIES: DUF1826 domain-containing protein [Sphingomonas]NJB97255.1 hypothetical protein [Sphingomonas trueperi]RSV40423.1 DUF1826 domain-containing protein [Sphingomonas sp. ABOLE]RSV49305.1 DUF1826 domain-containing protein [Sphingomonas sp. ABOLD]